MRPPSAGPSGQLLVARPCTHPGHEAQWQASFFDDQGASGHMIAPYRQLIEELIIYSDPMAASHA